MSRGMARADLVTSLVLIVLGLAVVEEAWRMPRYTEFGSSIWSAPGVVPGMIGLALALMGAALFVRARKEAAALSGDAPPVDRAGWGRVAVAFGMCVLFAGVLVGRIPFPIAAFVFMASFMITFDIQANPGIIADRRRLFFRVVMALALAALAAYAIATIFQDVFFVRLP